MLDFLIRWSLNHRQLVLALTFAVIVAGLNTLQNLNVDVFPDLTKPTVTVMTETHGMAPEEVETRVTGPIESFLGGLPGVERVRSQSGIGLSVIYVEFSWGTDLYRNRQLVQEKLALAAERLPRDLAPMMAPVGSLMGQIQQIVLTADAQKITPMQLRDLAEWVLRPKLLSLPGIAQVIAIGGGLKQYQIQVSADKLNQYQISIEQLDRELSQISQNTTGGFLEKNDFEYLVRNIGVVHHLEDIRNTLVGLHFGRPIFVKDIAEVVEAPRLKRGDGSFNGQPSVVLTLQKQPGKDTVQLTQQVENLLSNVRETLPEGVSLHSDVFKQADFIQASIDGIQSKLRWGAILTFCILLLFLANLRLTFITLSAIPISFFVTFFVFRFFDLSVNTMTLGGLAIAIGELVDDSIVDAENVFRRLKENSLKIQPLSPLKVIFTASSEVRNSIVLSTLIIVLVFLPLFQLDGLEGRLFTPLSVAYLSALMASLVVSLTLTPVMCYYLFKNLDQKHKPETQFVQRLKLWDEQILRWALPRSRLILVSAGLILLGSLALIPFMGRDFLPKFNEGTAMVALIANPGVSLNTSNALGLKAEKILMGIPEVRSVSRRTGRAELDEHAMGVNVSEIDIDFHKNGRPREEVLNDIRQQIKTQMPDVGVNIGQPISHLIDHMLSGVNAALAIKIFGPDLSLLREKAIELEGLIANVRGLVDLRVEPQTEIPQVKVHVLRDEAARFGLSAGEVTKLLEAAFNGETVTQVIDKNRFYDVHYQFDQKSRGSLEKMDQTILKIMPDGRRVQLRDVADVYESSGPNEINRENNQRRIVISANVSGRDLGGVVKDIEEKIQSDLKWPPGYTIQMSGQFESQQRATQKILIYSILSLLGIAFLLYQHFRSWVITVQIMTTIPLAFAGGIVSLFIVDGVITVASLVGFITLCGVASRNGVMMISHYLHLMKLENEKFSLEMIIKGSQERLVPVLMTASVASLALFPLVLTKGEPGSEVLHPVAVVIVGGLITSTLLDLIVTPTLFYLIGKKSAENYAENKQQQEKI